MEGEGGGKCGRGGGAAAKYGACCSHYICSLPVCVSTPCAQVGAAKLRDDQTINWGGMQTLNCLPPSPPRSQVGAAKLRDDQTINWGGIQGFRIAGKQGIGIIAACQVVLMGGPEYARWVMWGGGLSSVGLAIRSKEK